MSKGETLRDMLSRCASNITVDVGNKIESIADKRALVVSGSSVLSGSNSTNTIDSLISDPIMLVSDEQRNRLDYAIPSLINNKKQVTQQRELNADFNSDIKKRSSNVVAYLVMPDIHSYNRDPVSYSLAMQSAKVLQEEYNITKVVQLGDLIEGGQFSGHAPNSTKDYATQTYDQEIRWALDDFWARLQADCPDANYYQLMGNHEDRIDKYIARGLGTGKLQESIVNGLLSDVVFEEQGIAVTPYGEADTRDSILLLDEDIVCVHGWSFAANAARTHLSKVQGRSVIFGHTHRSQSHVERDAITNKMRGAWSFGSLAKNQMTYQKGIPNEHTNGFGLVLRIGEHFRVETIPVTEASNGKKAVILPVRGGYSMSL